MTAPNGPILFNNSTGSDTQSSGLGPSTAVYGAGASTTAASAVVTGIDTTGVSAGDLLWVQSSSGRQFSTIASVDSSTQVTCDDVFDNTESSRTWAIGGKRSTLENSKQLLRDSFTDGKPELHLETDQTISTSFSASTSAPMSATIQSSDGTQKTITQTASDYIFKGGSYRLQNIKLICTNATPATSLLRWDNTTGNSSIIATYCHFAGGAQTLNSGGGSYGLSLKLMGCEVSGFTSNNGAIYTQLFQRNYNIDFCYFHDNQRDVGSTSVGNTAIGTFTSCIFDGTNSGGWAIAIGRANYTTTIGCIFYNYTSGGWYYNVQYPNHIRNCLFVNCGTAINGANVVTNSQNNADFNYFFNNTTNYGGFTTIRPNDVQLTADPFTDAANGDFNLNATNGGGGTLRSTKHTLGG